MLKEEKMETPFQKKKRIGIPLQKKKKNGTPLQRKEEIGIMDSTPGTPLSRYVPHQSAANPHRGATTKIARSPGTLCLGTLTALKTTLEETPD